MKTLVLHNNNLPNEIIDSDNFKSHILKPSDDNSNYDVFIDDVLSGIFSKDNYDVIILPYSLSDSLYIEYTGLRVAMHIRLTKQWRHTRTPILLVGAENKNTVAKISEFGNILFTPYVYCSSSNDLESISKYTYVLCELAKMSDGQYSTFVQRVSVKPNANMGIHSLANQWGATVLGKVLNGCAPHNEALEEARKSLYFKYIEACTNVETIASVGQSMKIVPIDDKFIQGKRILLIDDEADKGWGDVLCKMLSGAVFKTISEQVADYNGFSDSARKEIENGHYDLIFLDLRMNGVSEEEILGSEEFSGMKILKQIKEQNRGTQVIMFTASNKAWNMRALIDAGADGYYIKESPEYAFPISYSENNAGAFLNEIRYCLDRSYLKDIYKGINDIILYITNSHSSLSLKDRIRNQLGIAFALINKARNKQEHAFAYIALEQIFELISDEFISCDKDKNYIIIENGEKCENWAIINKICVLSRKSPKKYPQWMMIASLYYQLFNGKDRQFGARVQNLIDKRSAFIHNNMEPMHQDIFCKDGFVHLFDTIKELISYF